MRENGVGKTEPGDWLTKLLTSDLSRAEKLETLTQILREECARDPQAREMVIDYIRATGHNILATGDKHGKT